ncbi:MAG: ISAzo13 family transposase [Planctomycetes bacterium]|nr:ISAzo13 family transposase [Planctomycetota bacterium]
MKRSERAQVEAQIRERYELVKDSLTERARRLFVSSEALAAGYGGIVAASRATGLAISAIQRGIQEIRRQESGELEALPPTRSRRPGGGRKKVEDKYPGLLPTLKNLVEATTRGDPESPLLWTARSLRNIQVALKEQGYSVSPTTLSRLLKKLGYSLQSNAKRKEGAQHPDRNAQFEHIAETVRRQHERGDPAISVDTKKKELVGSYKNAGRELRPTQDPEVVDAYDFVGELGKVAPYGVYDLAANEAWVSVGISHDTGEFAVASIRAWWLEMGKPLYPGARSLLITADGGGSNGYRLRLWKVHLQQLANELGFPINVCHLPPGTSKWNKIEHRLFSFITQNWRGKPLVTHKVIVELIAATTTKAGLTVRSRLDKRTYKKGIRVPDKEMAEVFLVPEKFHGEWNYTIRPNGADC